MRLSHIDVSLSLSLPSSLPRFLPSFLPSILSKTKNQWKKYPQVRIDDKVHRVVVMPRGVKPSAVV